MADTKVTIEKLNDGNYAVWKFKMKLLLTKEKLLKVVTDPKPAPKDGVVDATWISSDEKAQAVIGLALEDTQLIHVIEKKSAKEMWDALKDYHERASLSSIIHVVRQLITIRMPENGSMSEHLKEMAALRLRLVALGEEVKDNWFVALMLSSLPRSYDGLIVALESRPDKDLTVDFVKGKLLDEGRRRENGASDSVGEKALVMNFSKPKSASKSNVKKEQLCHYCKKEGHFRRDCRKLAQDKREKEKSDGQNASMAIKSSAGFEVCLAAGAAGGTGFWYLDSGATAHMTSDASLLDGVDKSKATAVCLADGKSIKSAGSGTGKLISFNGDGIRTNVRLDNVLHVPSLAGNLLSVSRITDLGFRVLFGETECHILKGEETVLVGQRKGGLYHLKQAPEKAFLVDPKHADLCRHLWHRRFGHRDVQALDKVVREDLGYGLKVEPCEVQSVCGPCCEGKMSRESFPKVSDSKSRAVGDLVHTDLGGPMEEETPSGNRFYIVLVDDYSRYTVVHLLRRKSDAEEKIRDFCNLVKNQFGHYPKKIRSDGGGEFTGNSLKKFFAECGIIHELTAPYSPQQNGVAERKNRYLVEMLRCMLSESRLSKRYWGEAICTANYLQNRLPSSTVCKTPFELWSGKKPSYGHLRIFGSEAYVHIPKEKRRKLDLKAEKLVFVGYADGRKAYRFLNPETDMIMISRDAKFLELCDTKEAVRSQGKETGGVLETSLEVPLTSPSEDQDETDGASTTSEENSEEEVEDPEDSDRNPNGSFYGSASEGDQSFRGFPLDEIARRSGRPTKGVAPRRLIEEIFAAESLDKEALEPRFLKEAITCEEKESWKAAMVDELKSHEQNGTWELVNLPAGRKAVGCRWVYKLKRNAAGDITKYKARLVAQGYSQKFGVDYDEIFAPVSSHTTLRVLLAVASKKGMTLKHFDVKTAYLYGDLNEEIFMKQPPGYAVKGKENMVCRLRKSIYGLKQSARCWNQRLHRVLLEMGFKQSDADPCLYTMMVHGKRVYLIVYVDDILVGCEDEAKIESVYKVLKQYFEMTNLGELNYFLGLEIGKEDGKYSVSVQGYIDRVAEKFGLRDAKRAKTPMEEGFQSTEDKSPLLADGTDYRSLVGALLYISVCARPDVAASVAILGRKVSSPTEADWVAAKRVARYLKSTKEWKLVYGDAGGNLIGHSDADWAGDATTRRSTTGFVFHYAGGAISWVSRRQSCVTLSSMESEYVALSEASQELIWLRNLLKDMGEQLSDPVKVMEDNQSCIQFVSSERKSRRSKHIEVRGHFVKQLCEDGSMELQYCPTEEMVADVLTKPVGSVKQLKFARMLGLSSKDGNVR